MSSHILFDQVKNDGPVAITLDQLQKGNFTRHENGLRDIITEPFTVISIPATGRSWNVRQTVDEILAALELCSTGEEHKQ